MTICIQNKKEKIMKKTYFAPDMEILEADIQLILAASIPTGSTPTDPASSDAPEMDDSDYDF